MCTESRNERHLYCIGLREFPDTRRQYSKFKLNMAIKRTLWFCGRTSADAVSLCIVLRNEFRMLSICTACCITVLGPLETYWLRNYYKVSQFLHCYEYRGVMKRVKINKLVRCEVQASKGSRGFRVPSPLLVCTMYLHLQGYFMWWNFPHASTPVHFVV